MGKAIMRNFHVIIPARLKSTRLPAKLLLSHQGQSIIERVHAKAKASGALSITIACDDEAIFNHVKSFGADVLMTSAEHQSGTDRVAEAARMLGVDGAAVIVNLQGDEPQMPAQLLSQVASLLINNQSDWASLYWPIMSKDDFLNPNVVKVVLDDTEKALYFSRSPIPYPRDNAENFSQAKRHIGLYAYRMDALQAFVKTPMHPIEQLECLEQLRALALGMHIQMQQSLIMPGQDINTREDFARFCAMM